MGLHLENIPSELVGGVGDGFLDLVGNTLLGVRSHLLLSLGGEILAALECFISMLLGDQRLVGQSTYGVRHDCWFGD